MPLLNGLVVAALAVILVIARVLWPKEAMERRSAEKRFRTSVHEMQEGLDRLEDQEYAAALALFKDAARKTPNKPAPVLLRIYTMGLQGFQREARVEFQQALHRWPPETLPPRLLALAALGAGFYTRAYRAAQKAIENAPKSPSALLTLGDICRLIERYPESERAYRQAVANGASLPAAGLAYVLACQGRIAEAEAELAHASQRSLSLFESHLALAQIHAQARRLDDAFTIYKSLLEQHRTVPRVVVPAAMLLLERGNINGALNVLTPALEKSSEDPFLQCALAQILIERNELAEATVRARESLRLWPNYGKARAVYGDILKRSGRYAAAEDQYQRALDDNPYLADVHMHLAALQRARNAFDEANEHEREAHRVRPDKPQPVTQEILAVATGRIATGMMPIVRMTPDSRPARPVDLDLDVHPTRALPMQMLLSAPQRILPSKPRPDSSQRPNSQQTPDQQKPIRPRRSGPSSVPLAPPPPSPELMGLPHLPLSDVPVFPGAVLLFDQSSDLVFTQTLQTDRPASEVRVFYQRQMRSAGWDLANENASIISDIQGSTMQWLREQQRALITIGTPPSHRQRPGESVTYIVSYVTSRATHPASATPPTPPHSQRR
jgi:tetratricopeptide (TPR) repeat protein